MKKLTALLLAVLMVASLSVAAFADDEPGPHEGDAKPGKITITGTNSNHIYQAYEVFAGLVDKDGVMSHIWWGCNITDAGKLELCKKYLADDQYNQNPGDPDHYATAKVAALVAGELDGNGAAAAKEFAKFLETGNADGSYLTKGTVEKIEFQATGNTLTFEVHHQGYYVVVDKPNQLNGTIDSSYTDYIVLVVSEAGATIAHKNDIPVMIKKVQENTAINADTVDPRLSNQTLTERYNDTADYSIGDKIPYELVASLPNSLDNYDEYNMEFTDNMTGLKYLDNSMQVLVRHTGSTVELATTAYSYNVQDPANITLTLNMKRNTAGDFELDLKAGGTTTVDAGSYIIVRYNATLTSDALIGGAGNPNTAYLRYSNNPTNKANMGQTTTDQNIVYAYALDILKVNAGDKSPIKGVGFKFQKTTSSGAADPAGYAVLTPVSGELSDGTTGTVGWKISGWNNTGTQAITNADGKINIIGLDKGHYFLTETSVPGENEYTLLAKPIEIAIDANTHNTQSLTGSGTLDGLQISITDPNKMSSAMGNGAGNNATGTVGITIANNATAQLPTTGGIGTTMFYAIGAVLALGAAVVLVAKRRMGVDK